MPDPLDVLQKAARAYRDAAAAVDKAAGGDAGKARAVAVLSGPDLAKRKGDLVDAERARREARKALHKAAEAAALDGAISHVSAHVLAEVPAPARGGARAPARTSPARARSRDVPAPAGAPARVRARTRGKAPPATSTPTRARAPAVAPPEGTAAAALLAWRLGLGLGRKAAGERLGVSGTYVGALEIGRARPSVAVAARVEAVAGVPVATWGELARPARGGRGRRKGGP